MSSELLELALVFASLSLLAVGGGSSLLPQMQRDCVERGWTTAEGFSETYSLGQIIPGPPMTMVALLGYHAAGPAGAAVVLAAFFLPACLLTWVVARLWAGLSRWRWRASIQEGIAPISIGLLLAGAYAIGQGAAKDPITLALAPVALALSLWRDVHPAWLVLGCGAVNFLRALL